CSRRATGTADRAARSRGTAAAAAPRRPRRHPRAARPTTPRSTACGSPTSFRPSGSGGARSVRPWRSCRERAARSGRRSRGRGRDPPRSSGRRPCRRSGTFRPPTGLRAGSNPSLPQGAAVYVKGSVLSETTPSRRTLSESVSGRPFFFFGTSTSRLVSVIAYAFAFFGPKYTRTFLPRRFVPPMPICWPWPPLAAVMLVRWGALDTTSIVTLLPEVAFVQSVAVKLSVYVPICAKVGVHVTMPFVETSRPAGGGAGGAGRGVRGPPAPPAAGAREAR